MVISIKIDQKGPADSCFASTDEQLTKTLTTVLCQGFIVVLKDCKLPLFIFQLLFYLNMVEAEHCTFFQEYKVILKHSCITVDMH
jgi:hypothetical protein